MQQFQAASPYDTISDYTKNDLHIKKVQQTNPSYNDMYIMKQTCLIMNRPAAYCLLSPVR